MRWISPPRMNDSANGLVRKTRRSIGKNANNHHGEVSSLCWRERYVHNYLVKVCLSSVQKRSDLAASRNVFLGTDLLYCGKSVGVVFKDNKKSISFYSGLVGNIGHHKLTAINVVIKAFQVTEAATNKLPEIITNITSPLNKRQLVNALLDCLHLIRKIIKDKYYYFNEKFPKRESK